MPSVSAQNADHSSSPIAGKIQRPYLYTGLSIRCRAKAILEHYQFVQSFPENKIKKILLSEEQILLAHPEGKTVLW